MPTLVTPVSSTSLLRLVLTSTEAREGPGNAWESLAMLKLPFYSAEGFNGFYLLFPIESVVHKGEACHAPRLFIPRLTGYAMLMRPLIAFLLKAPLLFGRCDTPPPPFCLPPGQMPPRSTCSCCVTTVLTAAPQLQSPMGLRLPVRPGNPCSWGQGCSVLALFLRR